ncbi:MAG: hypothetical protein M3245_03090 [Actinomycetota bacterium]|nr:hypothetical protein [Actinomycetota bacterium]
METKRTIGVLVATCMFLTLPASSFAQDGGTGDPTGLIASDNISLIGTIPNPGVIGARFRDDVMYVTSLAGLFTYDVSDPADPKELGRLPLPHFENEDVDLGGNILLISNDAAESTGILYVIDISDPSDPKELSRLQMGGNPLLAGPGHTASCILDCRFAWVTDNDRIRVIDLRDPAVPVSKGSFATPAGGGIVTHDVQVDGNGLAWVVGFGGAAAYRIPQGYDGTGLGDLVAKTDARGMSTYLNELGLGDGSKPNDFVLHNSTRRRDDGVVFITEEDYSRPGCRGAGSFASWNLPLAVDEDGNTTGDPSGEDLSVLDMWTTELLEDAAQPAAVCSAHYFDLRSNVVAQGWYEQGLRVLDVSDPADIKQVGYWIPPTAATWAAHFPPTDPKGRIIYVLDATHGIDVLDYDRPVTGPLAEGCGEPQDPPGEDGDAGGKALGHSKGKARGRAAGHGTPDGSDEPPPACKQGEPSQAVRAPVAPAWRVSPPTSGLPSRGFGYACRFGLGLTVG